MHVISSNTKYLNPEAIDFSSGSLSSLCVVFVYEIDSIFMVDSFVAGMTIVERQDVSDGDEFIFATVFVPEVVVLFGIWPLLVEVDSVLVFVDTVDCNSA